MPYFTKYCIQWVQPVSNIYRPSWHPCYSTVVVEKAPSCSHMTFLLYYVTKPAQDWCAPHLNQTSLYCICHEKNIGCVNSWLITIRVICIITLCFRCRFQIPPTPPSSRLPVSEIKFQTTCHPRRQYLTHKCISGVSKRRIRNSIRFFLHFISDIFFYIFSIIDHAKYTQQAKNKEYFLFLRFLFYFCGACRCFCIWNTFRRVDITFGWVISHSTTT